MGIQPRTLVFALQTTNWREEETLYHYDSLVFLHMSFLSTGYVSNVKLRLV